MIIKEKILTKNSGFEVSVGQVQIWATVHLFRLNQFLTTKPSENLASPVPRAGTYSSTWVIPQQADGQNVANKRRNNRKTDCLMGCI